MMWRTILVVLICCIAGQIGASTTREPSIQAYGLPKRFFAGNGYVQRVFGQEESAGGSANVRRTSGRPSGIREKFQPLEGVEDGTIEIIHLDSPVPRSRREVESDPQVSEVGEAMQADESKVFRPLFVYRQQVARRQRIQRERKAAVRDLKPKYNYSNKNSILY